MNYYEILIQDFVVLNGLQFCEIDKLRGGKRSWNLENGKEGGTLTVKIKLDIKCTVILGAVVVF